MTGGFFCLQNNWLNYFVKLLASTRDFPIDHGQVLLVWPVLSANIPDGFKLRPGWDRVELGSGG